MSFGPFDVDDRDNIADNMIDDDEYFDMDDPTDFLDWAEINIGDFVDTDSDGYAAVDYIGMLHHWKRVYN